jgi:DNA-binding NarL/FixJ family response regulator
MIRVVVVADSGVVMSAVTASLSRLAHVEIAAYANGSSHIDAVVHGVRPDVVLIHQMDRTGEALQRIAEIRSADPRAAVLGLSDAPGSRWVVEALRAGATAVVPADLQAATLDIVLRELVGAPAPVRAAAPLPVRSAA